MATKSLSRSKSTSLKRSRLSVHVPSVPDLPASRPADADVKPLRGPCRPYGSPRDPPFRADSATASGTEADAPRPKTASPKSNQEYSLLHPPARTVALDLDPGLAQDSVPVPPLKRSGDILCQEITMPSGIALGGPTHMKPGSWKQLHPPTPSLSTFAALERSAPTARSTTSDGGKKKSVWKSLFGKKEADKTPRPSYQMQAATAHMATKPPPPEKHADKLSVSFVGPPTSTQNRMTEGRKLSKAHRTVRHGKSRSRTKSTVDGKLLGLGSKAPHIPPEEDIPSAQCAAEGPLLNIDIPNVEMERYSVMFGTVLKRDRSSNLLQRRQGNKDILKPLNSESLRRADQSICQQYQLACSHEDKLRPGTLPRRATTPASPSIAPSSGFSLFPRQSMQESRTDSPALTTRAPLSPLRKSPQRTLTDPSAPIKFSTSPLLAHDANKCKDLDSAGKKQPNSPSKFRSKPFNADTALLPPPRAPREPVPELSPDNSARGSLDSAQSFETAVVAQGHQSDSGNESCQHLNSHAAGAVWEIMNPSLKARTTAHYASETTSVSDLSLSLQSQSPLSSLSGKSITVAQEKVTRENETKALERERERIRRTKKEHAQSKTKFQSKYSNAQAHIGTIDMSKGRARRHADVDTDGSHKRQPTLKERAEEVQNATRVAIARQVSISRQRAQAETIRASRAERTAERAAEQERPGTRYGANQAADQDGDTWMPTTGLAYSLPSNPVPIADSIDATTATHISIPPRSPLRRSKTTATVHPRLETTLRPGKESSHTGTAIATTPTTAPSLKRGASLLVLQRSPTGERLVERRNLTPVLVDIPNRKSAYGLVVDA